MSRVQSSVTEAVVIEVGRGHVSFIKLSEVAGGHVSLTSHVLL